MTDTKLALHLDRFFRTMHIALQAQAHEFDRDKIGPNGAIVLLTLADMGTAQMHEIAQKMARDKSQMTRMIKSLEEKGIVMRRSSDQDARVVLISLTDKGLDVVKTFQEYISTTLDDMLSPVSIEEKEIFGQILRKALYDRPEA